MAPPKKSGGDVTIVLLIFFVLLVLGGGGAGFVFHQRQSAQHRQVELAHARAMRDALQAEKELRAEHADGTGLSELGCVEDQEEKPLSKAGPDGDDSEQQELSLIPPQRLDVLPVPDVVVPWQEAHKYMGQKVAAEGLIVATHNSGRACFLNFDKDWKGKFHAVIFAHAFDDYPESPEQYFLNRKIRLIGKVGEHRGTSQIVVERPEQIVLLD